MDQCIVKTKYGQVRGEYTGGVYIWRGIPYADSPEGGARFKGPSPPAKWDGIRDAVEFGHACPQGVRMKRRSVIRDMSEDCLTLNIWSPSVSAEKLPVFFYIHGGSFVEGAGSDPEYEGTKLVSEGDIVLITVNYRLGAFGFMDFSFLSDEFYPNCGLRDLALALRWVNENIENFGGDKNNVTVGGQSAGAICAVVLPMLDEAKSYISRVIVMSAAPTLIHSREDGQNIAKRFMEFADIKDSESLKKVFAGKLVDLQSAFAVCSGLGAVAFGISVDGKMVKNYPIPAAKEGLMRGKPMFFGTTREEMSFVLKNSLAHIIDIEKVRKAGTASESKEVKERIQNAYKMYGKRGAAIRYSDFSFRIPSIWCAEAQSEHADTWMYRFDFETAAMRISGLHSFHSSDIPFLFGNFRTGLARLMLLLSPVKRRVNRVHREFRDDFLTFIKNGSLPWGKIDEKKTDAKVYTIPSRIEHAVPDEIMKAYDASDYRRRSFAGEGIIF